MKDKISELFFAGAILVLVLWVALLTWQVHRVQRALEQHTAKPVLYT